MRIARFWDRLRDGTVICLVCERKCRIPRAVEGFAVTMSTLVEPYTTMVMGGLVRWRVGLLRLSLYSITGLIVLL